MNSISLSSISSHPDCLRDFSVRSSFYNCTTTVTVGPVVLISVLQQSYVVQQLNIPSTVFVFSFPVSRISSLENETDNVSPGDGHCLLHSVVSSFGLDHFCCISPLLVVLSWLVWLIDMSFYVHTTFEMKFRARVILGTKMLFL